MMSINGRNIRYPFTASQWQELEHQALIYKYMTTGMPIPPDLLFTIRRSLDTSLSSNFLLHQPQQFGWNSGFHMGFGRKIDPEPGRCRRTDGKKWRCSKEVYPDSKYCERHMHRGRNRSRKPVENTTTNNNILSPTSQKTTTLPNAIPVSNQSVTKNSHSVSESNILYPNYPIYASSGLALSSQDTTNNIFLDSNHAFSHGSAKDYRNSYGHEIDSESLSISSTTTMRNDSAWQLEPLTMGSPMSQFKNNSYYASSPGLHNGKQQKHGHHNYYNNNCDMPLKNESDNNNNEPKQQVMHHFLDEWTPKDNSDERTQLSISMPNSVHDFFMTQKERLTTGEGFLGI